MCLSPSIYMHSQITDTTYSEGSSIFVKKERASSMRITSLIAVVYVRVRIPSGLSLISRGVGALRFDWLFPTRDGT